MDFTSRYQQLNTEQRESVDHIYGPVLVIAGPGSGKTELLAVRIANILCETDADAANILCITFTDNAAKNMRDRLASIIGSEAYRVAIHTFHTFGLEILEHFRYKLPEEDDLTPIDDIRASQIFHELIQDLRYDHPWKKKNRLTTLKNTISLLKQAGISSTEFSDILTLNEQILNDICPIIEFYSEKIFILGRKKEDNIQKIALFGEMQEKLEEILQKYPKNTGFQETLATILLRSIDDAQDAITSGSDTKPITAWKNTWLEKTGDHWTLQEMQKMIDSRALLPLYEGYERALRQYSLVDFSDMILRAIRLVESDDSVRAYFGEKYQWIMIDEYQDTNDAQLRLIMSILEADPDGSPNIFAVGDDDQSIFKFQGANIKNIRLFLEKYSDTRTIILKKNYRSRSEIIDFSRSIMTSSTGIEAILPHIKKEFEAVRGESGEVELARFSTEQEEIEWIVSDIENRIQNGTPPEEIAIISKKNETLERIAKLLLQKQIPVTLSKEENIFDDAIIRIIVNILIYIHSLVQGEDRDDLLIEILSHPMWQIHRLTLWELSRAIANAKKYEKKIWIEALRTHPDHELRKIASFFIELSIRSTSDRLEDLIDLVTGTDSIDFSEDYTDEGAREQLTIEIDNEKTVFRSPLYEYYFSQKNLHDDPTISYRYLSNIRKLIESIRTYRRSFGHITIADFATYIALIQEYSVHLSTSNPIGSEQSVHCSTVYKAKGLEYSVVYAPCLTEKQYKRGKNTTSVLPSNLALAPEKDNDEDVRRLLYTLFTRAKNTLIASYHDKTLNEKNDSLVSILGDIQNWTIIEPKLSENNAILTLHTELHDILSLPYSSEESSFLREIIANNFSLSATALQNFLDVSTGGPSHFLANNILRFPQAKSPNAIYGSAIHKALEDFFTDFKNKKTYRKEALFLGFEKSLLREGLEKKQETDFLTRGHENLEALYTHLTRENYGELHLEYRFTEGGGIYLTPIDIEPIRLTGAIDRIEITSDGKMIITDYKTGSGFDSLDGGGKDYEGIKKWKYRLQLTFYALLFANSPRWKTFSERQYHLFFVEQDRDTKEFYEIYEIVQQGEIERMEALIIAVMQKIRTLDFPDTDHYSKDLIGIREFEEDLLGGRI